MNYNIFGLPRFGVTKSRNDGNMCGLPRLAFGKSRNDDFLHSCSANRRFAKAIKSHSSLRESQRDSKQSTFSSLRDIANAKAI